MLSPARKRLVGFAAIIAGVAIVVGGVWQPNPFKQTTSYWAEFNTVQGLGAIGRDVRLAGVNVGVIGEVKRVDDNAVVEIVLEQDFPVHVDARADMRPHTLFEGSSFIDFSPGSPRAALLEPGGTIPVEQTSNYVTLDEALRVLRPEIRESLRDLAATGSKTLRDGAVAGLQKTLKNAPELTRNLKGPARALQGSSGRELSRAISGMADTVDAVASREQELVPLTRRLNRTAAALTVDGGAPLDATVAALPGALRELEAGAPALTGLVDRLDRLAVATTPALPDFALALEGATPLLERSIPVLRKTTPIIVDLRKISARLTDATPTLAQLIETVDPVSKTFGESVLPVLHQDSRRGPPTYEQLLATFSAANAVFRPYQHPSQNPNGSGHLWQLATYVDFGGPFAGLLRSPATASLYCERVAAVSAAAAESLAAQGSCR